MASKIHPDARKALNSYSMEELEAFVYDSVCDSVCTHCGAQGPTVEPDACDYACESCGHEAVSSVLVLLGLC